MKNLFSSRGASRGFRLAGILAILWGSWALGFLQGVGYFNASTHSNITPTRVQALTGPLSGGAA